MNIGTGPAATVAAGLPPPNAALARSFFTDVYGAEAAGWLTLGYPTGPYFRTEAVPVADLDTVVDWCSRHAASYDVFFGVGLRASKPEVGRRGKSEDVGAIPGVWCDVDFGNVGHKGATGNPPDFDAALAVVRSMPLLPTCIVSSGHGLHGYWLFPSPLDVTDDLAGLCTRWLALLKHVAGKQGYNNGVDSVADLARILRVPGTINHKVPDDPKPVAVMEADWSRRYTPEQLVAAIPDDLTPGAQRAATVGDDDWPNKKPASPWSKDVQRAYDETVTDLHAGGARHEAARAGTLRLVRLRENATLALRELRDEYKTRFAAEGDRATPDTAGVQFDKLVDGAEDLVRADPAINDDLIERLFANTSTNGDGKADESKPSAPDWPAMEPNAYRGLAGDVVRRLDVHTEADPAAMLMSFLTMYGNAVGPGPHVRVGADRHAARLFTVIVGQTSRARKGSGFSMVRSVMAAADCEWSKRMMSGFGSGERMVDEVSDGADDVLAKDCRLLVREGEYARILKVVERENSTLSPLLREAWDGGVLSVRTRAVVAVATGAHISVVGDITAEELRRGLSSTEVANGFGNRFLHVLARRSKRLPSGGNLTDEDIGVLAKKVQENMRLARQRAQVTRTAEAEKLWDVVYATVDDTVDGLLGAMTARAEAYMVRLSLIYALLDLVPPSPPYSDSPQRKGLIDVAHIWAAVAVWSYCEQSVQSIFGGDRTGDPVVDKLLDAIRKAGKNGMTFTEQNDLFKGRENQLRLSQARNLLVQRGLIRTVQQSTPGAPRNTSFPEEGGTGGTSPPTFFEQVCAAVSKAGLDGPPRPFQTGTGAG